VTDPVPPWAREWFSGKQAEGLAQTSLNRYSADLKALNLDLSTSSLQEIKTRLAECSQHYSRAVLRHLAIIVKQVLRDLDREKDAKAIKLPKRPEARVVFYTQADVDSILANCRSFRDRLLVDVLVETGARRGELFNMRIKDVQFDEHSAILWLHGKTGTRQRRVYDVRKELQQYLNAHPQWKNPEAKFWLNKYGQPLSYQGIYKTIHRIGYRTLHRDIYPHGFRHTAATKDVKSYTDREMMIRYGWNRSEMVGVYAHLNASDVDEKELALHGLKDRICQQCHGKVSPTAKFCENCGQTLTS
jgi:integrase